jgi:hypothetical protein
LSPLPLAKDPAGKGHWFGDSGTIWYGHPSSARSMGERRCYDRGNVPGFWRGSHVKNNQGMERVLPTNNESLCLFLVCPLQQYNVSVNVSEGASSLDSDIAIWSWTHTVWSRASNIFTFYILYTRPVTVNLMFLYLIYSETCIRRNRMGPKIFSTLDKFPHYTK